MLPPKQNPMTPTRSLRTKSWACRYATPASASPTIWSLEIFRRASRAASVLAAWQSTVATPTDRPSQELADLLTCSRLVTEAALTREESRGAHYRDDFQEPREDWRRHLVFRREEAA